MAQFEAERMAESDTMKVISLRIESAQVRCIQRIEKERN